MLKIPKNLEEISTLLEKAQAKVYGLPETPLGIKLKKQLWNEDVAQQLEGLISEENKDYLEEIEKNLEELKKRQIDADSKIVNDVDYAMHLLEEKIKPALNEVLQPTAKAKEPRIILQRGDGSLRDKLIQTASPAQCAYAAAVLLYDLAVLRSPMRAVKDLSQQFFIMEAISKIRPFGALYDPFTNTILCRAFKEDSFLLVIAHEYVHFLQHTHSFNTPRITYSKFLSEGHAEASALAALHLMKEQGKLGAAAVDLHWNSRIHLANTYFTICEKIRKTPKNDDDLFIDKAFNLLKDSFLNTANAYDTGSTLFRLAELKNGKEVYARMLIGDVAALKI